MPGERSELRLGDNGAGGAGAGGQLSSSSRSSRFWGRSSGARGMPESVARLYLRDSPIDPLGLAGQPKEASEPASDRVVTIRWSRSLLCFKFSISCRIDLTVSFSDSICDACVKASSRISVSTMSFSLNCFLRSSTIGIASISTASTGFAFSTIGMYRCGLLFEGERGGWFFWGVGGGREDFESEWDERFVWRFVFVILALREKAFVKELRSCFVNLIVNFVIL